MKKINIEDMKLCYVEKNFAYFTSQDLNAQWGDDWDVAPYENNAEEPYLPSDSSESDWKIELVAFDGYFETPADIAGGNSSYSVELINKGAAAWLFDKYNNISIMAGTSLKDFIKLINKSGGDVYMKVDAKREIELGFNN